MTKALFFNVPSSGHVNPSLPVTAELVRRGVQVIYYLTESYRQKVEATGAEFRSYPAPLDDTLFDGLDGSKPPLTAERLVRMTHALLPALEAIIHVEKPDVILHDSMCPWGWIVAQWCGIPSVSSMSLLLFTAPMMIRSGMLPDIVRVMVTQTGSIRTYGRIAQAITARTGVRLPTLAAFLNMQGTITLSYTSHMFQPLAAAFGNSVKFVGPMVEPRPDAPAFPFDQLNGQPLIYVALGTVVNHNVPFYKACIAAFRDAPVQVVMSIGQQTPLDALGTLPPNFIVRPFVAQLEVLARASVFITHAGMNSVHEGLYFDVPLILVPQQTEQTFVANRVADLGAGVRVARHTPENLRHAAELVLTRSEFRQRAREIGESLRAAGGVKRAADEVIALM